MYAMNLSPFSADWYALPKLSSATLVGLNPPFAPRVMSSPSLTFSDAITEIIPFLSIVTTSPFWRVRLAP